MKENSDYKIKYSEDDIIKMLEFLVDNTFVVGKVFQQTFGIIMLLCLFPVVVAVTLPI